MKFLFAIFLLAAIATAQNTTQNAELSDSGNTQLTDGLQKFATDDFKRQLIKQFTMCTEQCKEVCQIRSNQQDNEWTQKDLEYCHHYACGCKILRSNLDKVDAQEEEEVEKTQEPLKKLEQENAQENQQLNSNEDAKQAEEQTSSADLIVQNNQLVSTQELTDSSTTQASVISAVVAIFFIYAVGIAIYRAFCRYDKLFSRKQEESYLILNDTDHYQRLY